VAGVAVVVAGAAVGIKVLLTPSGPPLAPACPVTNGSLTYQLSLDQAANGTTIAAVGKRLGLPDHAVTVALAAALQESQLHNLDYGDLDSRGLFQQRPSQGWGTAAQVMTPHYAAAAFFQHLALVPNWPNLPVTVAAQQVQHSAGPNAYAQWEGEARALAEAMTGEKPAAMSCHFPDPPKTAAPASLQQAITTELGPPNLGVALPPARGWTVATWLVGHAQQYGLASVEYGGQQWTASSGAWQASPSADSVVHVTYVGAAGH
jgi:hypothetical protein